MASLLILNNLLNCANSLANFTNFSEFFILKFLITLTTAAHSLTIYIIFYFTLSESNVFLPISTNCA